MWRKTSEKSKKKLALKVSKNLISNSPQMTLYIESGKLAVGALSDLPVDPPGRLPTVRNPTVGATIGRPGRPSHWSRESNSLSVDPYGRPKLPESRALWSGRPVRSAVLQYTKACTSVHVGRPVRSADFSISRLYLCLLKPETVFWD